MGLQRIIRRGATRKAKRFVRAPMRQGTRHRHAWVNTVAELTDAVGTVHASVPVKFCPDCGKVSKRTKA